MDSWKSSALFADGQTISRSSDRRVPHVFHGDRDFMHLRRYFEIQNGSPVVTSTKFTAKTLNRSWIRSPAETNSLPCASQTVINASSCEASSSRDCSSKRNDSPGLTRRVEAIYLVRA